MQSCACLLWRAVEGEAPDVRGDDVDELRKACWCHFSWAVSLLQNTWRAA